MDFLRFLQSRQGHQKQKWPSPDFLMPKYKLSHSYAFDDELNDVSSPLSISLNTDLIAVVTEYGNVCLLTRNEMRKVHMWQAHNNAIFDTKWRFGYSNQLLTASGDQTIVLWDTSTYKNLLKLEGAHKSSIKSVSFGDENMFASGARDGVIKIWDIRCAEAQEMSAIADAHPNNRLKQISSKRKKTLEPRSDPLNTVTCVLFVQHTHYLYSSGANDATIKLWDLRKLSVKGNVKPVTILPYLGTTSYTESHGFPSLALDSHKRLYCSCSDHCIYCYCPSDATSAMKFVGHQANNYTKIKVLDDKYLISGSTGGKVYLWSLSHLESNRSVMWPSYFLPHGTDEITAVDCVDYDLSIYTCSDDQRMKHWEMKSVNSGICDVFPSSQCEAQRFERQDVELVDVLSTTKRIHKAPVSTPLSLITNWLQVRRNDDVTPTNVKVAKKSNSTPKKRTSKENNIKWRRLHSSKKLLFRQNKKISDYFTDKLTQ